MYGFHQPCQGIRSLIFSRVAECGTRDFQVGRHCMIFDYLTFRYSEVQSQARKRGGAASVAFWRAVRAPDWRRADRAAF